MPYREFPPDARLRGLVRAYWELEEEHGGARHEHLFMPERMVSLSFQAGESYRALPGGPLVRSPLAAMSGLSLAPQQMVSLVRGVTRVIGAELYPWAARQLLGWDMQDAEADLSVRFPAVCAEIVGLLALNDPLGARARLEAWLLALQAARAHEPGKAVQAAARLYLSLGTARVSDLADELNVSRRHLERGFVQEVGVAPKTLARLIRFEEVHNRLWWQPGRPLAELAYDLGFADQAHLTREFRALGRMTPGAFSRLTAEQRDPTLPEVWRSETETDAAGLVRLLG